MTNYNSNIKLAVLALCFVFANAQKQIVSYGWPQKTLADGSLADVTSFYGYLLGDAYLGGIDSLQSDPNN